VSDLAELAEVFGLRCRRCGRAGADVLEHPAELRAFLHPQPLTGTARPLEQPVQLRTICQQDVERIELPVHRRDASPGVVPHRLVLVVPQVRANRMAGAPWCEGLAYARLGDRPNRKAAAAR